MIVELDVFSGRPNPRWVLDDRDAEVLRAMIAELAPAEDGLREPPGLGYRGFIVIDGAQSMRAFAGRVTGPCGVLADPARHVERYLIDHLPPAHASLQRRLSAELFET